MKVELLNEKVKFYKNFMFSDKYGNHKNEWNAYYHCFATIGGEGLANSKEEEVAGTTVEDAYMTVTIRYCKKAALITSTGFRVKFRDEFYDIVNVDHMNYRNKCVKLTCRKVRR